MRILVVHEERDIADTLANILCEDGHHALALCDRIEALDHLGKIHFDLALVGVVMPDSAGVRLAERLSDINNPLGHWIQVMLLVTKDTMEILKSQGSDFEYLLMPIEVEQLLATIRKIEDRSAMELRQALEFLNEYGPSSPDQ
jgi:two-component system OmpR family response regulator